MRAHANGVSRGAVSACGERRSGGGGDVCVRIRVTGDAPAALGRLGDQHPGPFRVARVAGCGGDDLGQLLDDSELLVTAENADRRKDLDTNVVGRAGCVRDCFGGEIVDEGGVLSEKSGISGTCSQRMTACARF